MQILKSQMNTTHDRQQGNEVWLTPPHIIEALGPFDLDPCQAKGSPFRTAKEEYTEDHNGLVMPWFGRVFCNPPYGKYTGHWLEKCALHGCATALVFARTDTRWFHDYVLQWAYGIFFFRGRLRFYDTTGKEADHAGAPTSLTSPNYQ